MIAAVDSTPGGDPGQSGGPAGFEVHLENFEGPFDLLLGLISKHKLDITEVALSQVTDEFIAYIRARADSFDLDQASYFLVVAATLLDLKAARLLPEVLLGLGPAEFALIAGIALAPRPTPVVSTEHIHTPRTSVREQAEILAGRLRDLHRASFRELIADCAGTYEVVARFLAVLELYREGNVSLEQAEPLGDLYVTWAPGGHAAASTASEEYG